MVKIRNSAKNLTDRCSRPRQRALNVNLNEYLAARCRFNLQDSCRSAAPLHSLSEHESSGRLNSMLCRFAVKSALFRKGENFYEYNH